MIKYLIIIEKADDGGYGGWVPDLPGCIGMGETYDAALDNTVEGIKFHLEGLKAEGLPIPQPNSKAEMLVLN